MNSSTLRGAVIVCGTFAALLGTPAESHAIFHWFGCNWFGGGYAYRPVVVGAAPQTCGYTPQTCGYTPQVCQYAPQTSYRLQFVSVPTTTYAPTSACDPCTGSLVTTMRPVTAYVRRLQYVPYTSYRPVYTSACSTCATGACPTTSGYAPSGYAPSTCSSCAPASSTGVPTSYSYEGAYNGTYNSGSTALGGSTFTPQPSLAPENGTTPEPQTSQRPSPADAEEPESNPANKTNTSFQPNSEAPRLIDPDDRTAVRPIPRVWGHAPILPPSGTSGGGEPQIVQAVHRQPVDLASSQARSASPSPAADAQQPAGTSFWRPSNR